MKCSLEAKGINELIRKLDHIGGDTDGAIDIGLFKGAEKVRGAAVKACPKDTGHLKRSIVVEKIDKGYAVGTNVKYAPYVEYGTGTMGDPSVPHTQRTTWKYKDDKGNWHTTHGQKAQPFLMPALENNKQAVINLVRNQLRMAIRGQIAANKEQAEV